MSEPLDLDELKFQLTSSAPHFSNKKAWLLIAEVERLRAENDKFREYLQRTVVVADTLGTDRNRWRDLAKRAATRWKALASQVVNEHYVIVGKPCECRGCNNIRAAIKKEA